MNKTQDIIEQLEAEKAGRRKKKPSSALMKREQDVMKYNWNAALDKAIEIIKANRHE